MRRRVIVISLSLAAGSLMLAAGCHESPAPPAPKSANDVAQVVIATDGGVVVSPAPALVTPVIPVKPKPAKIKITIKSIPPKALVFWGKKKFGPTPVQVDRPRDSGPMDFTVKSDGYFTVHTRAYTFRNEVLYVKLTKLADKMTLFGAKQELPPEPSPSPAPAF